MAKSHTFKKTKPGKPIPVTARELENFMLDHKGKFNSRDYDKFERMELINSSVRDANLVESNWNNLVEDFYRVRGIITVLYPTDYIPGFSRTNECGTIRAQLKQMMETFS